VHVPELNGQANHDQIHERPCTSLQAPANRWPPVQIFFITWTHLSSSSWRPSPIRVHPVTNQSRRYLDSADFVAPTPRNPLHINSPIGLSLFSQNSQTISSPRSKSDLAGIQPPPSSKTGSRAPRLSLLYLRFIGRSAASS
jgi:hypothetical protein